MERQKKIAMFHLGSLWILEKFCILSGVFAFGSDVVFGPLLSSIFRKLFKLDLDSYELPMICCWI